MDLLTAKEEKFIRFLCHYGTVEEASKAAGYTLERGLEVFSRPAVAAAYHQKRQVETSTSQILTALRRLALSPGGELQLGEGPYDSLPLLDLFHISKLKVEEKGVEVTFYDRLKALQLLLEYTQEQQVRQQGKQLIEALAHAGSESHAD